MILWLLCHYIAYPTEVIERCVLVGKRSGPGDAFVICYEIILILSMYLLLKAFAQIFFASIKTGRLVTSSTAVIKINNTAYSVNTENKN